VSVLGTNWLKAVVHGDLHAPRRRKRQVLARAAGLSETPSLIYTLQSLLR
jgi:hypothetical protein